LGWAFVTPAPAGTKIPEDKIQARLDVLKSMGYEVNDNPFAKPDAEKPTFDTTADTDTEISQNFVVKLTPKVSTPTPVYVVEGDKPTTDKLKDAVTTKGNDKTVDESKIPETKGKVPMPYFILGFIFMSILGSYVTFLKPLAPYFVDAAYIFLGMAMAALGMSVNFKVIKERGVRVFTACFLSSVILMIVCYVVAKFIF